VWKCLEGIKIDWDREQKAFLLIFISSFVKVFKSVGIDDFVEPTILYKI